MSILGSSWIQPGAEREGACAVAGSLHLASASSGAAGVLRSLLQLVEGASAPALGLRSSSSACPAPLHVHLPMLLAWPCSLLALTIAHSAIFTW